MRRVNIRRFGNAAYARFSKRGACESRHSSHRAFHSPVRRFSRFTPSSPFSSSSPSFSSSSSSSPSRLTRRGRDASPQGGAHTGTRLSRRSTRAQVGPLASLLAVSVSHGIIPVFCWIFSDTSASLQRDHINSNRLVRFFIDF